VSATICNFAKYKIKQDVIDPHYAKINELSIFFRKFDFKEELNLLSTFYEVLNHCVNVLEKANWDKENSEVITAFREFNFLAWQIKFATQQRLDDLMSTGKI